MPIKHKCAFCGEEIEPGTGTRFVTNEGVIHSFCSSKCRKNHALKRNPIKVRWTRRYREFMEEVLGLHKKKAKKLEKPKEEEKPKPVKKKKVKKVSKRKERKRAARKLNRGKKK